MRTRTWLASGAALLGAAGAIGACAAKNSTLHPSGAAQSGAASASGSGGSTTIGSTSAFAATGAGGMMGCAKFSAKAQQAPAAMLILLDRSASMADNNKWVFAAQATVQALDQDVFDTMSVGLMAAPSGPVNPPACLMGLVPEVACGVPPFPQVDLKLATMLKSSDAMGVRHDIKSFISMTSPEVNDPDSTPMYGAIQAALNDLQALKNQKRVLLVVSDGSWDCNVFSNRPGYDDCNGCKREWEDPQNVVGLLSAANQDANAPVETFIVGVPGADTYDPMGCMYPPYHMRAALSAIAYAGSPKYVPSNCTGKTYTQSTPDPQVSCHIDLTQGNFNANALAAAIAKVRGAAVGCVYPLPAPPLGQTIDPSLVNVELTIDGKMAQVPKRALPSELCAGSPWPQDGCWDYDAGMQNVLLVGAACDAVNAGMNVDVEIVFGCKSFIK